MDYRGSRYNKGRAGHVRNVNSYSVYRQKMKRWKYPFMGLSVLLLFFFSFEVAGEFGKADVLSSFREEARVLFTKENLDFGKKVLMNFTKQELDSCRKLSLAACDEQGKSLLKKISAVSSAKQAEKALSEVETYLSEWEPIVLQKSCEQEVGESRAKLETSLNRFKKSLHTYTSKEKSETFQETIDELQTKLSSAEVSSLCLPKS